MKLSVRHAPRPVYREVCAWRCLVMSRTERFVVPNEQGGIVASAGSAVPSRIRRLASDHESGTISPIKVAYANPVNYSVSSNRHTVKESQACYFLHYFNINKSLERHEALNEEFSRHLFKCGDPCSSRQRQTARHAEAARPCWSSASSGWMLAR